MWNLALRLGVPGWVAPLVAPTVDLSVAGLLLGIHHLAAHGYPPEQLRPARRLLTFASVVTLALNTADPLLGGQFGKAAFDAVGRLLLIDWAGASCRAIAHASKPRGEADAETQRAEGVTRDVRGHEEAWGHAPRGRHVRARQATAGRDP